MIGIIMLFGIIGLILLAVYVGLIFATILAYQTESDAFIPFLIGTILATIIITAIILIFLNI